VSKLTNIRGDEESTAWRIFHPQALLAAIVQLVVVVCVTLDLVCCISTEWPTCRRLHFVVVPVTACFISTAGRVWREATVSCVRDEAVDISRENLVSVS